MRKNFPLALFIIVLLSAALAAWIAFPLREHQYKASDKLSYWFYTPDTLKNIHYHLEFVDFQYSYDIDDQRTLLVMTWKKTGNTIALEKDLQNFLQTTGQVRRYNCAWTYRDLNDYSSHYERYCLNRNSDTLELEYYKIEK